MGDSYVELIATGNFHLRKTAFFNLTFVSVFLRDVFQVPMNLCLLCEHYLRLHHTKNMTFLLWHTTSGITSRLTWLKGDRFTVTDNFFFLDLDCNSHCECFSDSYSSFGTEALAEAEKNRRIQAFCPAFEHLVSLVSFHLRRLLVLPWQLACFLGHSFVADGLEKQYTTFLLVCSISLMLWRYGIWNSVFGADYYPGSISRKSSGALKRGSEGF